MENLVRLRFDKMKNASDFYPMRYKKYPIFIRLEKNLIRLVSDYIPCSAAIALA